MINPVSSELVSKSKTKIVTLGGGTGAPTVIQSLILAGFSNISAISASTDSGGKTGIIRSDERDQVIAVSDLLRNLLALISPTNNHRKNISAFTELLNYTDGRNRNLGYRIYYSLLEKYHNDFLQVQRHLESLLGIKFEGTAIPVTLKPTNIHFQTKDNFTFKGEHELDRQNMSKNAIKKAWLDPQVPATPDAISAIKQATHIIYCPGSLYGSLISNLLPQGINSALKQSSAHKILITNLVSTRNQTHHYTPFKYFKTLRHYTQLDKPFDTIITPYLSQKQFEKRFPQITSHYRSEHSHFLGWTKKDFDKLSKYSIKILKSDNFSITPQLNRLRHDPKKLGKLLSPLLK